MPKTTKKTLERVDCLWGLMCSSSSLDRDSNNISVFNVINQLNLPYGKKDDFVKDGVYKEHELIIVLRRMMKPELCTDKLKLDIKISSVDPSGKVLAEILAQMPFETGKRMMHFRVKNNAFKVTSEGDYVYRVEILQPGQSQFTKILEIPYLVNYV